jgi:hypothetical protein
MYDSNEMIDKIRETVFKMTKQHRIAISAAFGSKINSIPSENRIEFK